jgi:hypothetical protein
MKNEKFGGAGVELPTCDYCHGQLKIVAIRGRYGRYCSQKCCAAKEDQLTDKEKTELMAKKATKKATKKAPARKATKKAPAKKATRKATSTEMFRPGATKYDIWQQLAPGKPVKVEELYTITEAAGKTRQLVSFVLSRVRKNGYTVIRDREAGTIQVTK